MGAPLSTAGALLEGLLFVTAWIAVLLLIVAIAAILHGVRHGLREWRNRRAIRRAVAADPFRTRVDRAGRVL